MVPQNIFRRLLIEPLAERIVFHGDELEEHGDELRTIDGLTYFYDPPPDLQALQAASDDPVQSSSPIDDPVLWSSPIESAEPTESGGAAGQSAPVGSPSNLSVPVYHSNPSFPKKIYLDFDGHIATGTFWNNRVFNGTYNTGAVISAPAFSRDGDLTTFSTRDLELIQEVWARVSEDYAPFQVDVTTEEPSAALFTQGGQAVRAVITTTIDAVTGQEWYPAAGGVAFLNTWYFTNGTPCWVFGNYLADTPKYFADATSHEIGHTFGLSHDGRTTPVEAYYSAHGSGATRWGPIMGSGYSANLSQWSQGEYTAANNSQDDLAIINAGVATMNDEHGNSQASATQLIVGTASSLATSGVITTRTDVDAFRFPTQAGSITLNVDPFDYTSGKANLDAMITLLNSSGTVVATVDDVTRLNSTLTLSVAKGFYTLLIDGAGRPAIDGDDGYSDYASLGRYSVSGSIVPNAAPTVVNDAASVVALGSVLIDVLGNDSDANNDLLSIASIGTPASGVLAIESGKIRYTAGSAPGNVTFSYVVVDELGLSSTGSVTVTVQIAAPPTLGSVVLGNGSAQRSMIQQVTVTIDGAVTIASGAFTVVKRGAEGGSVTTTAAPIVNGANQTIVTLTFSGAFTRGAGILSDGYYQLTIDGSKITQAGVALDTNGDGQGGDSYTLGGSESDNFFALYGDTSGDGVVGVAEFGQFRSTFGKTSGQAGFDAAFDFEGDGVVGVSDFGQFRSRFGKTKPTFS